jgi:hypothetical protein
MLFILGLRARHPNALCDLSSEFSDPCPDRLITHNNTALSEQTLDVVQAERKPTISPKLRKKYWNVGSGGLSGAAGKSG